jgi:hypothetical protein
MCALRCAMLSMFRFNHQCLTTAGKQKFLYCSAILMMRRNLPPKEIDIISYANSQFRQLSTKLDYQLTLTDYQAISVERICKKTNTTYRLYSTASYPYNETMQNSRSSYTIQIAIPRPQFHYAVRTKI